MAQILAALQNDTINKVTAPELKCYLKADGLLLKVRKTPQYCTGNIEMYTYLLQFYTKRLFSVSHPRARRRSWWRACGSMQSEPGLGESPMQPRRLRMPPALLPPLA